MKTKHNKLDKQKKSRKLQKSKKIRNSLCPSFSQKEVNGFCPSFSKKEVNGFCSSFFQKEVKRNKTIGGNPQLQRRVQTYLENPANQPFYTNNKQGIEVYEYMDVDNTKYAIKFIDTSKYFGVPPQTKIIKMLNTEIELLTKVRYPFAVKSVNIFNVNKYSVIILPFISSSFIDSTNTRQKCVDLYNVMINSVEFVNLQNITKQKIFQYNQTQLQYDFACICSLILLQMIASLFYLHSRGIAHFDIKPSNILVDEDGQIIIGDYGLANCLNPVLLKSSDVNDKYQCYDKYKETFKHGNYTGNCYKGHRNDSRFENIHLTRGTPGYESPLFGNCESYTADFYSLMISIIFMTNYFYNSEVSQDNVLKNLNNILSQISTRYIEILNNDIIQFNQPVRNLANILFASLISENHTNNWTNKPFYELKFNELLDYIHYTNEPEKERLLTLFSETCNFDVSQYYLTPINMQQIISRAYIIDL